MSNISQSFFFVQNNKNYMFLKYITSLPEPSVI